MPKKIKEGVGLFQVGSRVEKAVRKLVFVFRGRLAVERVKKEEEKQLASLDTYVLKRGRYLR